MLESFQMPSRSSQKGDADYMFWIAAPLRNQYWPYQICAVPVIRKGRVRLIEFLIGSTSLILSYSRISAAFIQSSSSLPGTLPAGMPVAQAARTLPPEDVTWFIHAGITHAHLACKSKRLLQERTLCLGAQGASLPIQVFFALLSETFPSL